MYLLHPPKHPYFLRPRPPAPTTAGRRCNCLIGGTGVQVHCCQITVVVHPLAVGQLCQRLMLMFNRSCIVLGLGYLPSCNCPECYVLSVHGTTGHLQLEPKNTQVSSSQSCEIILCFQTRESKIKDPGLYFIVSPDAPEATQTSTTAID